MVQVVLNHHRVVPEVMNMCVPVMVNHGVVATSPGDYETTKERHECGERRVGARAQLLLLAADVLLAAVQLLLLRLALPPPRAQLPARARVGVQQLRLVGRQRVLVEQQVLHLRGWRNGCH